MREEILRACFGLFARWGIRRVGVEEIVAGAEVSSDDFHSWVGSKENAAEAYLQHLYLLWAGAFEAAVAVRGEGPEALLGLFDAVEALCGNEGTGRASLVHVLAEFGPDDPLGRAAIGLSALLRSEIARLAHDAGLARAGEFAADCHLLLAGCILSRAHGSLRAVEDARGIAQALITAHLKAQTLHP